TLNDRMLSERYELPLSMDESVDPTPDPDSLARQGAVATHGLRGVFPSLPPGARALEVSSQLARFEGERGGPMLFAGVAAPCRRAARPDPRAHPPPPRSRPPRGRGGRVPAARCPPGPAPRAGCAPPPPSPRGPPETPRGPGAGGAAAAGGGGASHSTWTRPT